MIPKFPNPNHYPYWIGKSITLPSGPARWEESFQLPRSGNWIFRRAFMQYPTVGAALPTTWQDPLINLLDLQSNQEFSRTPFPVTISSSPGRYDTFTSGQPWNGQVFNAKSIDRIFVAKTSFIIQFSNFQAVAPIIIDIALQGEFVLTRGRLY